MHNILKAFLIYLFFLVPFLLLVAVAWSAVSRRLYYCWDNIPLLDFIPPFVHADLDSRDHYIASPWIVYATWSLFLVIAFGLPLLVAGRLYSYLRAPDTRPNSA